MKWIMTSLLLCSVQFSAYSQEDFLKYNFPIINDKIQYDTVISSDSVTKDNFYLLAKDWINKKFEIGKSKITLDDREAGQITAKCTFSSMVDIPKIYRYSKKEYRKYYFDISFYLKDNKTKMVINNIDISSEFVASGMRPLDLDLTSFVRGAHIDWGNSSWKKKEDQEMYITNSKVDFLIINDRFRSLPTSFSEFVATTKSNFSF